MSRLEGNRAQDRLDAIAARARMDSPPALDVTVAVLRRLRVAASPERPMYWLAAGAIAAAALVALISMPYLNGALDPLTEFIADADTTAI